VTDDYRKLLALKDIGAVFITSPDFLHEEHAVAALKSGQGGVSRKAMRITVAGATGSADAYGGKLKLYMGHNMRHMSVIPQDARADPERRHRAGVRPAGAATSSATARRVLQGLARRPEQEHQPAAPERRGPILTYFTGSAGLHRACEREWAGLVYTGRSRTATLRRSAATPREPGELAAAFR